MQAFESIEEIERALDQFPLDQVKELARRLTLRKGPPRCNSEGAANHLYEILATLQRQRKPCPSNAELARLLREVNAQRISYLLKRLRDAGRITLEHDPYSGTRSITCEAL